MNDSSDFSAPLSVLWQENRPPSEAAAVLAAVRQATAHRDRELPCPEPHAPTPHSPAGSFPPPAPPGLCLTPTHSSCLLSLVEAAQLSDSVLQPAIPSGQGRCSHCPSGHSYWFQQKHQNLGSVGQATSPHHICRLCLFSGSSWEYLLTPHTAIPAARSPSHTSLTSLPASPCPQLLPHLLPRFTPSYSLVPLSLDPVTPLSYDPMPSTSVPSIFPPPSQRHIPTSPATALPTPPGGCNESRTIYRPPGFILAICSPSRYFYCTSSCAIAASETA